MRSTAFALLCLASASAWAEPYLAVREGLKCMQCHVNPTGGGMRSVFGHAYAKTVLAADRIVTTGPEPWADSLDGLVTLGGDLRVAATYLDVPNEQERNAFDTQELRAYLAANVIPDRLIVYVDQHLAPGAGLTREAYARLSSADGRYYVKAGQMVLPYGLRLEDDTAFIREVPGINFTTPDDGVEIGFEAPSWSVQAAISNGTAGGSETDKGKQASLRAEFVRSGWRVGASYNHNDSDAGLRRMQNLFAGLRTGTIAWLAEADYVLDDGFAPERGLLVGLLEANWGYARGHNLKLTGEYFDPDDDVDEDQQVRYSAVWEYTPIQFLQLRIGGRVYDGIPQNDLQNRRSAFVELHGFF